MRRCLAVLVLVIGSLVTVSATETFADRLAALQSHLQSDPTNTLILFQLGDLYHDEGANNNEKAVILAEGYFKRLLAIDPNHAMARVLYGSVLTMKARDALWPTTQLSYVKAGNRQMDAAVKLAPRDAQVRFTRAVNNFHMPDIMGREEIVQEDLAWLWQQPPSAGTELRVGQKQKIALYYGLTLQKENQLNEALQVWRAGMDLAPKSEGAAPLNEQLKKHKFRSQKGS
jgi:tetratricopeptide (TPR) repeat protein